MQDTIKKNTMLNYLYSVMTMLWSTNQKKKAQLPYVRKKWITVTHNCPMERWNGGTVWNVLWGWEVGNGMVQG